MSKTENTEYLKDISDSPADLTTQYAIERSRELPVNPEEGLYIYDFTEKKMLYAHGWEGALGIGSDKISLLEIISSTATNFTSSMHEINTKALAFLKERNTELEEYSLKIKTKIINSNGEEVPFVILLRVHSTNEDGSLRTIMGRFTVMRDIKLGMVTKLTAAYGPEKDDFIESLDDNVFETLIVSEKELEALRLVESGFAFKQIAAELGISPSAVQKRIYPMFERFGVVSLAHLISFAHKNYLFDGDSDSGN